jgi:hypothetical protein
LTTPEEDLLHVLLRHDSYFIPVSEALPLEWIDINSRGGTLLLALLNEAANGHFKGLREAVSVLDPELQTEVAKLSSNTSQDNDQDGELKSRINRILKSFHQRRIQIQTRQIEAQIASTPSTEVDKINSLLTEKIKLRKESLTPPSLPQTGT